MSIMFEDACYRSYGTKVIGPLLQSSQTLYYRYLFSSWFVLLPLDAGRRMSAGEWGLPHSPCLGVSKSQVQMHTDVGVARA